MGVLRVDMRYFCSMGMGLDDLTPQIYHLFLSVLGQFLWAFLLGKYHVPLAFDAYVYKMNIKLLAFQWFFILFLKYVSCNIYMFGENFHFYLMPSILLLSSTCTMEVMSLVAYWGVPSLILDCVLFHIIVWELCTSPNKKKYLSSISLLWLLMPCLLCR